MLARSDYHNVRNQKWDMWAGWYLTGPKNAVHNYVGPGAMVHGNMHDPNPWNYNTWYRKNWSGRRYNTQIGWGKTGDEIGYFDCLDFYLPTWERDYIFNQALARLYDEVRGGLDLGVDVTQARQLRRMFKGLREAEALARTVGSGFGKGAANGWLEFQYGWKPLYQDLWGTANEMTNRVLNTLKKFRASFSLPMWENYSVTTNGVTLTRNTSGKQACTIVCTFEIPGFSLDRFSSLNPVSLVWENIPYSFVIDWIYDVGSFLRSLETSLLYATRFKSGYASELYYIRQHLTLDGVTPMNGSGYTYFYESNDASYKGTSFARRVLSSIPTPRAPSIHVQMGWQRWLSAGALMRQLMR